MGKEFDLIIAADLINPGYSLDLDLSQDKELISRVMIGADTIFGYDDAYKDLLSVNSANFSSDIGYSRSEDNTMEIFKAKKNLVQLFKNNGLNYEDHEDWLMNLDILRDNCINWCLNICEILCRNIGKDFLELKAAIMAPEKDHSLTFYNSLCNKTDFIIKPQQDDDFMTIQLFNDSEIMIGENGVKLRTITPTDDNTLIYLGRKAEIFSNELVAPTYCVKNDPSKNKALALNFSLTI